MVYDWKNMNVLPKADLAVWNQYESGVSANGTCNDYSGNSRHLTQGTTPPVLTADVINGQPGWYFGGSGNPLVWSGGSVAYKHFFIVASCDDTTFASDRGLLSGTSSFAILVGLNATTRFYDLSSVHGTYIYKKSDLAYALGAQTGPMTGAVAIIEVSSATGITLDGLQIGKHRSFGSTSWKGYFFENIAYTAVKNDYERLKIYQYLTMRYTAWQKDAAGLNIFPFVTNKARSSDLELEHYLSEPYSGDPKALVRGTSKRAFTLPFTTRTQAEFEATETFHQAHYPLTHFVHRDFRFYPARDSECRITSSLREQGSDVSGRFNYSFDIEETS